MAAKIKLQRKGAKSKPFYRVVVQDESAASASSIIEILGTYNPLKEPSVFDVDKEKTLAWIKKGAKPTDKVRLLLGKVGILPPVNLALLPKKKSKIELKAEAGKEGAKPAETKKPAEEEKPVDAPPEAEMNPEEVRQEEQKA
ncbi:30S ribosomal protein S16 [candidate division WOR-1 bacterium RIFCSPLOWO2_02_FULL_46_20]|uniref:Small ribosomal subunit protein bS16 n=2 Tax=Saganbacteria TaxID=1703751 RepID=A0A1F4RBF4_UNCSA|nr:MAG: 30S ribosomal protein S16 [candidate division WOR-1 bacterium RIFCSPHIGHO2_02_FULL_45_12]OGC05507.1 MAG: 30S ribosomal protein S16 [candidate division WOR-1 bacterium RIFCSPLOWO2_02_FULL_46_20]OGC08122.1 MAG: 30S ribosomal protein S16 [candidate division WOR-1 bacterium RIFCSPLOWO2_12_FULL_45_9]